MVADPYVATSAAQYVTTVASFNSISVAVPIGFSAYKIKICVAKRNGETEMKDYQRCYYIHMTSDSKKNGPRPRYLHSWSTTSRLLGSFPTDIFSYHSQEKGLHGKGWSWDSHSVVNFILHEVSDHVSFSITPRSNSMFQYYA